MKNQRGLSFLGFIIIAVFVGAMMVVGFKMIPTYVQYFSVKSIIARVAKSSEGQTPAAIKESFSKSMQTDYVTDINAEDLKIVQGGGVTRISLDYERVVPLAGNVSFLFSFSIDESSGRSSGG